MEVHFTNGDYIDNQFDSNSGNEDVDMAKFYIPSNTTSKGSSSDPAVVDYYNPANATTTRDNNNNNNNHTSTHRVLKPRCGGCFRLNAEENGATRTINGKSFMETNAHSNSPYAVTIRASSRGCYTPGGRPRIL